jgi:parallel beta-helix repeat protein
LNQLIIKALGEHLPPPSLSEYAVALEVVGKSDHLTFYQCQMLASKQAVSTWFTAIIVRSLSDTDEAASHLTIEECLISGGHYSLRMTGLPKAGLSVNNRIINNEIVDYHQSGIQLFNQHNILIEGNRISRPERIHTEANWVYGIYFRGVSDGMQIIGNRIHGFSTVPIETAIGIYSLHGTRSSAGAPILIANNHISGYDHVTDMHYGIMLNTENGAGFVNIYHNTVLLDANNYSGNGLVRCLFHAGNFAVLDIRNNLFSYTTNSTGPKTNMYISNWSTTLTSNHNVFHRGSENTTQQNTVHFPGTTAFASLPAWQAADGGAYDQQSSAADPPIIFSDEGEKIPSNPLISTLGTDLTHILPTDINGIPRSDTPSPGSHEFEAPACLRPSGLQASGITQHSAMLGWTANGNEIAWQIEYGLAGFEPGTGTLIPNINENPYTVEDLVASTNYHFYVQALCGSRTESAWAGPYRFQTACDVFSTPLFEDFDDPFAVGLPACWEAFIINSNANSSVKKVPGTFNNVSYSQPYHIEMNDGWTSTPDLFLISPQIENGLSGINLRFMAKGGWADLTVEVGTWSADEEFSLVEAFTLTTSYEEYVADFSAYDGPDTKIAFRHGPGASGGRRIYLDDIKIYQAEDLASCSGQVSNLDGEAVEGAKVFLANQTVITDETGFYTFDNLLPGSYNLRAEAGGYAVEELWLSAGAGDELTQDIVFQYANPKLPHNPTEAGVIEYPADVWTFNGSATDGHYIYKSMNNWTLYVYDSSDLENIAEVSNISLTMPELVFHYHHLYVFTWKSVRVYNTDDPTNLQLISTFALEGIPIDLLFKEQTAWLLVRDGDMNSRLLEIDISNPASLNILATVNVVSGDRASAYLIPSRDLIYVHGLSQDQPANISIVDVSVAGEPVIVYSETHGVINSRMAAGEDHFFLAQNVGAQGQILAYSTANPAIPVLLAEQDLPEQTVVSEMSNINGTLMIHTLHPQHGHRLISMVFDEDEN